MIEIIESKKYIKIMMPCVSLLPYHLQNIFIPITVTFHRIWALKLTCKMKIVYHLITLKNLLRKCHILYQHTIFQLNSKIFFPYFP